MKSPWNAGWLSAAACLALLLCVQPAAARTLDQIRALNTISMCAHPDALPYATNNDDLPGFQVEIGRAIAQKLGVGLRVEWLVPLRRIAEVNCDMLMDRPSEPATQGDRRLSIPYHRSGIALAVREGAPDAASVSDLQQHARVGVMVSSLASVVLGRQGVRTRPYAFQLDMLDDLRNGDLSAAAVSESSLRYFIRQHPDAGVRAVALFESEPELSWNVSVALRGADQALQDRIDDALTQMMDEGTLARIFARYGIEHRRPSQGSNAAVPPGADADERTTQAGEPGPGVRQGSNEGGSDRETTAEQPTATPGTAENIDAQSSPGDAARGNERNERQQ
jgi:polar amino acid transport system substrate-binding protein